MRKLIFVTGYGLFLSLILFAIYQKSNKQNFVKECPYCHSKKLIHNKPIYKYTENFVIPSYAVDIRGSTASSTTSKPIAHFDVEYHCNNCNDIFHRKLEVVCYYKKIIINSKLNIKSKTCKQL